jgi:hypothetical protein
MTNSWDGKTAALLKDTEEKIADLRKEIERHEELRAALRGVMGDTAECQGDSKAQQQELALPSDAECAVRSAALIRDLERGWANLRSMSLTFPGEGFDRCLEEGETPQHYLANRMCLKMRQPRIVGEVVVPFRIISVGNGDAIWRYHEDRLLETSPFISVTSDTISRSAHWVRDCCVLASRFNPLSAFSREARADARTFPPYIARGMVFSNGRWPDGPAWQVHDISLDGNKILVGLQGQSVRSRSCQERTVRQLRELGWTLIAPFYPWDSLSSYQQVKVT